MQMNSCFFIGHADAPESVLVQLMQKIEELIAKENIRYFYVGKHGNFDRLAALAVKNLKKSYPFIQLILVLPYHPGERSILVPDGFDGTYYPEGMETVPKKYAIIKANRKMIENVDWLIAYVWHPASNARKILELAQHREQKGKIHVVNLGGKFD